jgi:hypothetical protein
MEGGGSNEHFSLPFVLYPMLVMIKYIFKQSKITRTQAFLCGLCFAIVSQIRLNNTAIIVGICFAWVYYYIKDRKYGDLFKLTGLFMIGMLIVYIPLLIYFLCNDALYDMFYTSILYNIKYKQTWGGEQTVMSILPNIIRMASCLLLPIISYTYDKKNGTNSLAFCLLISLVTFITSY